MTGQKSYTTGRQTTSPLSDGLRRIGAKDFADVEARYRRAKACLLADSGREDAAAREFLAARSELRRLLESLWPDKATS